VGAAIFLTARSFGGYYVTSWAPFGLFIVGAVGLLLMLGWRPGGGVIAAAIPLVGLATVSAASPAWGGVPNEAWQAMDRSLLAAAALLAGGLLTRENKRGSAVFAGVLAGLVAHALEVLTRIVLDSGVDAWFAGRALEGPAGYKNAQAGLAIVGVCVSLWAVGSTAWLGRVIGGAASALFVGLLLLTQSRGGLIALGIAVIVQLAAARKLTLILFVFPLVAAAGLLGFALSRVDAALVEGAHADRLSAFRFYVGWTSVAAAVLALVAGASVLAHRRMQLLLVFSCVLIAAAGLVGIAAVRQDAYGRAAGVLTQLGSDDAPDSSAGETRFASLSLNGRRDAWRVAREVVAQHPLIGTGQGTFAAEWAARRHVQLDILQPHSLELELLSELGILGFACLVAFVVIAVVLLLRATPRRTAAAALGALVGVVAQASADWTWSFVAVVASVLLLVGGALGGRARYSPPVLVRIAFGVATLAAMISLAPPYLAARSVEEAQSLSSSDPARAYRRAQAAHRLNPWDPAALELEASLAVASGELRLATDSYAAAARLSRQPWLDDYRRAQTLAALGDDAAARAVCRRAVAANPLDQRLSAGACFSGVAGNAWPVTETSPDGPVHTSAVFDRYLVDDACSGCALTVMGGFLQATIEGSPDHLDTAYAVRDLRRRPDWSGRTILRDRVRVVTTSPLSGNLPIVQVRDVHNRLIYEIYLEAQTETVRLWSPEGGLDRRSLNEDSGVVVRPGDMRWTRVDVAARADVSVVVRVNGRERIRREDLGGASTGAPRYLRAGVIAYGGDTLDHVTVRHADISVVTGTGAESRRAAARS
jgi:O-antigen ligase